MSNNNNSKDMNDQTKSKTKTKPSPSRVEQNVVFHLEDVVHEIDGVIRTLGETRLQHDLTFNTPTARYNNPTKLTGRKRKRKLNQSPTCDITTTTTTTSTPPRGLERQYRDLYNLLRIGLLGSSSSSSSSRSLSQSQQHQHRHHLPKEGEKRNVSALLMGPRGHGKNLVLRRCLASLHHEFSTGNSSSPHSRTGDGGNATTTTTMCRIVRLNGILQRGDDVGGTVREIVRQLSEIAAEEHFRKFRPLDRRGDARDVTVEGGGGDGAIVEEEEERRLVREEYVRELLRRESYVLRMRQTSFNSSLALLDEILRTAFVDSIPIVIVLEELDAFLGNSTSTSSMSSSNANRAASATSSASSSSSSNPTTERHLLLYHLLDRVAGHGSLLTLVGMTSRLSTVSMFEKRVKSRAEGTSKVVYFGHFDEFDTLAEVLLSKFDNGVDDDDDDGGGGVCRMLKEQLKDILSPSQSQIDEKEVAEVLVEEEKESYFRKSLEVRRMFRRNYELGKDVRWFCRVLSISLSLLAEDLSRIYEHEDEDEDEEDEMVGIPSTAVRLEPRYLLEGLMIMGGTKNEDTTTTITSLNQQDDIRRFTSPTACSYADDELMTRNDGKYYYGATTGDGKSISTVGTDYGRIRALLDLPGPQVAVLLTAKRILARDAQNESAVDTPLTFDRIKKEFETNFIKRGKASGPDRYGSHILYQSFRRLLEVDLMRPAKDHTGAGPLQYYYGSSHGPHAIDEMILGKVALHLNVDVERELVVALQNKILDCTTALRDWGLKGTS